jgi:large subunit ribosomal protein L15
MHIHQVTQAAGKRPRRKRVGRGESSGMGRTSGRGNKGCQARAGGGAHPLHEGGQMPIFRRIPKRGFSNFNFRTEYEVVNVGLLDERFGDGDKVNVETLRGQRLISGKQPKVKILGQGDLRKKLAIEVHACSDSARQAVEKAGGSIKLMERRDPKALWKAKRNSKKKTRAPKQAAPKKAARGAPEGTA